MKRISNSKPSESDKLSALYKLNNGGLTQAEFGAKYGIGSQGMVSQYLHGVRPLNLEAAKKFAEGLRVRIADFSPRLTAPVEEESHTAYSHQEREMVSVLVKPELKGKMQLLKGRRALEDSRTKLYMLYEEAITDYLLRHGLIDNPEK